jgi:membrane-bound lytic murein transglycosylase D
LRNNADPRWWLILWAITVAGCESTSRMPDQAAPVDNPVSVKQVAPPAEKREPVPTDVWTVLRDGFELNHQTHEPSVARAVETYLAAPTLDIEAQARRYLAYVVEEVRQRQLPMELALVPIIESTLNPYAYSHSGAAGSGS